MPTFSWLNWPMGPLKGFKCFCKSEASEGLRHMYGTLNEVKIVGNWKHPLSLSHFPLWLRCPNLALHRFARYQAEMSPNARTEKPCGFSPPILWESLLENKDFWTEFELPNIVKKIWKGFAMHSGGEPGSKYRHFWILVTCLGGSPPWKPLSFSVEDGSYTTASHAFTTGVARV